MEGGGRGKYGPVHEQLGARRTCTVLLRILELRLVSDLGFGFQKCQSSHDLRGSFGTFSADVTSLVTPYLHEAWTVNSEANYIPVQYGVWVDRHQRQSSATVPPIPAFRFLYCLLLCLPAALLASCLLGCLPGCLPTVGA